MLTDQFFKDLLSKYDVKPGRWEYFRDSLRAPIERAINEHFSSKPNYRYGGSLAKGTANSNSCDVDLLVYFDSDFEMSVGDIYKEIAQVLTKTGYMLRKKNSAIYVYGKDYKFWDGVSVDVVPGKYSGGGDEKDVHLYCYKDGSRLKSNPEKQIDKIKTSSMKQVIRLIKLLRTTHGFEFRSFFLELFAVDVVEPKLKEDSSLTEKLLQFASQFKEIGVTKVYDPANPHGNNIMGIHDESEFEIIRNYIKDLYEVLLTDDEKLVKDFLMGTIACWQIDGLIKASYEKSAKSHSQLLNLKIGQSGSPALSLSCQIKGTNKMLSSEDTIGKETCLRFSVNRSSFYSGYKFQFIISNAGIEARLKKQLRGEAEEKTEKLSNGNNIVREEHTEYNGNHYVQAIGTCPNKISLYSAPFIVKVRDYE